MRGHMKKISVFLIMFVCVGIFMLPVSARGKTKYYKIPRYENFKPNKAADDIEYIVNQKSVIVADGADNKVYINGEVVAQKHNEAVAEIDGYIAELNNKGMHLNRDLANIVTVETTGVTFSEFAEIVIDESNLSKITGINTLKIVLENKNEYIALTKDSIGYILENYKEFKVEIKKISETYTIRFLDKYNNIIEKYGVDIKLALPAEHREQTVYLFMNNVHENWGGQYSEADRAMEVMTKYSGEYNVASPQIVIEDIDELSDYEQQAVRFMVVRGYFDIKDNKLRPKAALTRYDFAEALVRMFFAVDNDAKCNFTDVDGENYRYVAASQRDNIVRGFEDGTFRGNENVTVEQVVSLTARTINSKNGYVYPENTDKYMNFTDDNIIGDWAEREIALAVREGIYSADMNLRFAEDISRKDAAVMLYRLFMIMSNTPEPVEEIKYDIEDNVNHETVWNRTNAIITVISAVVINIAAFAFSILFIKKKRKG